MAISDFKNKQKKVANAIAAASRQGGAPLLTPAALANAAGVPQSEVHELLKGVSHKFGVSKGYTT